MSNGALPKMKPSKSSIGQHIERTDGVINSGSDFSFELKPKPKLTCIPETSIADVRKTQSLSVANNAEKPEKSWSVLFIGSKSNMQSKGVLM